MGRELSERYRGPFYLSDKGILVLDALRKLPESKVSSDAQDLLLLLTQVETKGSVLGRGDISPKVLERARSNSYFKRRKLADQEKKRKRSAYSKSKYEIDKIRKARRERETELYLKGAKKRFKRY